MAVVSCQGHVSISALIGTLGVKGQPNPFLKSHRGFATLANTLEPRPVKTRDIWVWMKESFGLFQRRLLAFVCISVIFHVLAYTARHLGGFGPLLGILLCQISIALTIVIAETADRSRRLKLKAAFNCVRNSLWYLLILTLLYAALFIAAFVIGKYIDIDVPSIDYTAKPLYQQLAWLSFGQLTFLIIYMGIVITSFWFLNPLLALHSLKMRDAIMLARRAENINVHVVFIASYPLLLAMIGFELISELSLFANIFLVPLFGIYQYVSYRHVFLGKKENSPATIAQSETVVATADAVR